MNAFDAPDTSLWNVQYSTNAGNMRPNADKHNAPNKEINNSKFGIATASKTRNKKNEIFFITRHHGLWSLLTAHCSHTQLYLHVIKTSNVRTAYSQINLCELVPNFFAAY